MLDGNVLLRQKRDEVPEGTLSCPDRNLAVFHHYRHYEDLRLLPSVYDSKLIQQTLIIKILKIIFCISCWMTTLRINNNDLEKNWMAQRNFLFRDRFSHEESSFI